MEIFGAASLLMMWQREVEKKTMADVQYGSLKKLAKLCVVWCNVWILQVPEDCVILSNGRDYYVHRGCLVLSGPFIFRNPEFLGNYDTSQIYHWVNSLNA